jgi:hypothetical protein
MLALVIASFGALAKGQTISGTIVGTVTDQSGAILAGVGVTATNDETALTYPPSVTDARGMFTIPEVPPGTYHVRAQFSGFQAQEHKLVSVEVNRVTEEDFVLQIFVSTTPVVVTSAAPMTDMNMPTLGENFNQGQVRELPLLSRDVNNLALLAPGVESVRTFSFASTLVPFATSGNWGRYNNFIVDSVSNNEPIFGGAATQFTNADIFSDYAILTSVPKAEFGRDSGSTINVITKSGSSKMHGTLFWFGQDNEFNAMTRADTAADLSTTPPAYEQKIGATLGGPLGKKSFFFVSYQFDRARTDLSNVYPVIGTVPTTTGLTALRAVTSPSPALATMLAYPSIESIPGLVGQCFAGTPAKVGNSTLPNTANPCFQTGGVTSTPGSTAFPNPGGYQFGSFDVPQGNLFDVYDHQASGRIDRRLNDSNDFYVRYLVDDLSTPQAVLDSTGDVAYDDLGRLPDARSVLQQRTQSALFDERYARASSLNEVRFSFGRIAQGIGAYNLPASLRSLPAATVADTFGGFGAYGGNFPSAGSEFTLGQDTSPAVTHSNIYEAQENFSLTRNRHSIKMGADFVRTQSNIINVPTDLGHYFFGLQNYSGGFGAAYKALPPTALGCNSSTPAAACSSFAPAGYISGFVNEPTSGPTNAIALLQSLPDVITTPSGVITGQGQNELPLRELDEAFFIQDDFHVASNVTLSAGLRYERFGQPIDGILKINPAASPIIPTSAGDFGPRFGIAWSPDRSKTVIRAGYALMYNQMPLNIPLLMWQSYPISPQIATVTPSGGNVYGFSGLALPPTGDYPNSPLTWQGVNSVTVKGCNTSTVLPPLQVTAGSIPLINCSTQNTVASNLVTPYIQTWSMGVQRELSRNMLVEVNYVGTKGTKLYQRVDQNPYGGWNTSCLSTVSASLIDTCLNPRLNPNRGDITAVTNGGLSTYNGLQASLNTRTIAKRGNTLTFTAAYTWSHMIDTDSEIFGPSVRFGSPNLAQTELRSPYGIGNIEAITPLAQTYNDLAADKGNSSYDRRQRFVFSEVWGLPTPTSSRAAKAVFGGWNLNGVGTVQTGQPYTPLNGTPYGIGISGACADANGDGQLTNDRPNIGNPSAPLNSVALLDDIYCRSTNPATQTQYTGESSSTGYIGLNGQSINPANAHFVQVPIGTNQGGNAGRNILTGPGILDFDLALFKQFHWGESKVLEFRWEVYNVFNRPNAGYLLGNVYSTNAEPTPGFAFASHASPAGVTGGIPENALDATTPAGIYDFLNTGNMNTGTRTMQFGVHFSF